MKVSRFTVYLNNNREFHRHYLDLVSEWGGAREWGGGVCFTLVHVIVLLKLIVIIWVG